MSAARPVLVALAGLALVIAARVGRHGDEARVAIGPAARAIAEEIEATRATDAMTAAEIVGEKRKEARR